MITGALGPANLPATWYAKHTAARALKGCAQLDGTTITLGAFAVPRAATGRLDGIHGHVDRAIIDDLTIRHITADIPTVTFSPLHLLANSPEVALHHARITAVVTAADLTSLLRARGLPVTARIERDHPVIDLDLAHIRVAMALTTVSGALNITARGWLLPPGGSIGWHLQLPGATVTAVAVEHDNLVFSSTLTGNPATPTCALRHLLATSTLLSQLSSPLVATPG